MKKIRFSEFLSLFPEAKQHEFGEARGLFFQKNERVATVSDANQLNKIIETCRIEKEREVRERRSFEWGPGFHGYNHFWD